MDMESRVVLNTSSIDKELKMVEYPGIVKSQDNMLQTLGGIGRVSQVLCEQVRRMELIFHPENRYAKPAYGDSYKTAGLLIKVRVRKQRGGTVVSPPTYSVEVLGHVKKSFRFNSLADFQYLPILRNPETNHFEYIYNRIMPKDLPTPGWLNDPKQQLLLVPSVFARSDVVQTNLFRIDQQVSSADGNVLGVLRTRPNESKAFYDFSLTKPIPTAPNPIAYKAMMAKLVNDEQFDRVKKLFEKCPIWSRVAIVYEANITTEKLKTILPAVCYYFRTGPWRTMHVRYGYDPRKDFESRYYQTFDYRIRFGARLGAVIKTKRRTVYTKGYDLDINEDDQQGLLQDVNYPYYEEGRLPRGRQSFYRYCDIRIPKVKEMLDKIPTPLSGATCNEKTGWLPATFSTEVRAIVYASISENIRAWKKATGQDAEVDYEDDDFGEEEMEEEANPEDPEGYEESDDLDLDEFMNDIENE